MSNKKNVISYDFASLYPTVMKEIKIDNKKLMRKLKYKKLFENEKFT